jgi:hypothetical protein
MRPAVLLAAIPALWLCSCAKRGVYRIVINDPGTLAPSVRERFDWT